MLNDISTKIKKRIHLHTSHFTQYFCGSLCALDGFLYTWLWRDWVLKKRALCCRVEKSIGTCNWLNGIAKLSIDERCQSLGIEIARSTWIGICSHNLKATTTGTQPLSCNYSSCMHFQISCIHQAFYFLTLYLTTFIWLIFFCSVCLLFSSRMPSQTPLLPLGGAIQTQSSL